MRRPSLIHGLNRARIGRRGALLLTLGFIYLILGFSMVTVPAWDRATRDTYAFPIELANGSLAFWGGMWITVGTLAAISAFWRVGRDAWGFGVMASFTILWSAFGYLSTLLLGSDRGWVVGVIWTAFSAVILICSGMKGANDE